MFYLFDAETGEAVPSLDGDGCEPALFWTRAEALRYALWLGYAGFVVCVAFI